MSYLAYWALKSNLRQPSNPDRHLSIRQKYLQKSNLLVHRKYSYLNISEVKQEFIVIICRKLIVPQIKRKNLSYPLSKPTIQVAAIQSLMAAANNSVRFQPRVAKLTHFVLL